MLNIRVWIATLAVWTGVSFTLCVLGGVLAPGLPIRHQTLELLLPGFNVDFSWQLRSGACGKFALWDVCSGTTGSDSQFFHRRWAGSR